MDFKLNVAPGANNQYVTVTAKEGDATEMEITFIGDEAYAWAHEYLVWKTNPPGEAVMSVADVAILAKCQALISGFREVLGVEEKQ